RRTEVIMMHEDLDEAIRRIDEAFGAGYAKGHPALVAALVQAAAFDRVAKAITSSPVAGDLARKFLLAELTELTEQLEEAAAPQLTATARVRPLLVSFLCAGFSRMETTPVITNTGARAIATAIVGRMESSNPNTSSRTKHPRGSFLPATVQRQVQFCR